MKCEDRKNLLLQAISTFSTTRGPVWLSGIVFDPVIRAFAEDKCIGSSNNVGKGLNA